jgi:hypothetical protein
LVFVGHWAAADDVVAEQRLIPALGIDGERAVVLEQSDHDLILAGAVEDGTIVPRCLLPSFINFRRHLEYTGTMHLRADAVRSSEDKSITNTRTITIAFTATRILGCNPL